MAYISFRADDVDSRRLKAAAAARGTSMQSLMQDLVRSHLAGDALSPAISLGEVVQALRPAKQELSERGVRSLYVFGSTARGENRHDSDVDLLVDIAPESRMSLTGFAVLKDRLGELLGRPVDLTERRTLEPRIAKSVNRDMVQVF